jgi:hypothetical protein
VGYACHPSYLWGSTNRIASQVGQGIKQDPNSTINNKKKAGEDMA